MTIEKKPIINKGQHTRNILWSQNLDELNFLFVCCAIVHRPNYVAHFFQVSEISIQHNKNTLRQHVFQL